MADTKISALTAVTTFVDTDEYVLARGGVTNKMDASDLRAGINGGYGTSLPGSPTDGMEYTLVDSTTAPTHQWRFRYNAGSASAYKWEFVGGSPKSLGPAGSITTSSTTYVDLTSGPTWTVPRPGDYLVSTHVYAYTATFTSAYTMFVCSSAATAGLGASWQVAQGALQFTGGYGGGTEKRTFTVAELVNLAVKANSAQSSVFSDGVLAFVPVRVS